MTLEVQQRGGGARVRVRDGGPTVPASAFDQLIGGRIDPTSVGRPAGLWLLVAECVAGAIGTEIQIVDDAGFTVQLDLLPPPA